MTSLRELQRRFVSALLWEDSALLANEIVHSGVAPSRRLQIYRNNAREGFLSALTATFPVIARLAGADWFQQTAWRYQQQYPSFSGNLHHVGEQFADYLTRELADSSYEYFADVARLEWAYQEVLIAADSAPLDFARLQSVAPEDQGNLWFRIAADVRWVRSRFPILAIWKANQPDADVLPVDIDSGSSNVLLKRRDDHVELREFSDADCVLLQALADSLNLSAATERFSRAFADEDLGAALLRLAQRGLITDFSIDANPCGDSADVA